MIINFYRLLLYGGGMVWLLLLPVDELNGQIYIDENALMPKYAANLYDRNQVIQLAEQLNQVPWLVVYVLLLDCYVEWC